MLPVLAPECCKQVINVPFVLAGKSSGPVQRPTLEMGQIQIQAAQGVGGVLAWEVAFLGRGRMEQEADQAQVAFHRLLRFVPAN